MSVCERERSFTRDRGRGKASDDPITNKNRGRNLVVCQCLVVCQWDERGPGSGRRGPLTTERSFDYGESKERSGVRGKGRAR